MLSSFPNCLHTHTLAINNASVKCGEGSLAMHAHIPDNDNFTLMDIALLICQVEILPTINMSADINNLCLILNVEFKLAGKVLQVFDLEGGGS